MKSHAITYIVKLLVKQLRISKCIHHSLVGITGQMRSRKYEKDNQTHFVTEVYVETIKFMSSKTKESNILSNAFNEAQNECFHIG